MTILSGKEIRPLLKEEIERELSKKKVSFFLYSNQEDYPSQAYLRGIKKTLDSFQVEYEESFIDLSLSEEENLAFFKEHAKNKSVLMARPLKVPYENKFISLIESSFDPDMLTDINRGYLFGGNLTYLTATSQSVYQIIKYYHLDVEGKKALVLGRSTEVGYPCFQLLNKLNAAVTLVNSKVSKQVLSDYVRQADIIVLATGKSGLIDKKDLKNDVVILDCGFNPNGGDLGFVPEEGEVIAYTPVPGGVGALTSYCLLLNALHLK